LQGIPGLIDGPATTEKRIDDQRIDPITTAIASSNIFAAMRTKSIATQPDVKTITILSSEQTAAQAGHRPRFGASLPSQEGRSELKSVLGGNLSRKSLGHDFSVLHDERVGADFEGVLC
jgi:hypothetical protein